MIEKEKFTEALDYMIQSPFVQKMLGSTSNDEDKLAREINQSTYRLVDIKNDLKKSHDIFVAVGQDNPKEFSEIAAKHILDSYLTPMSEKCESAKKTYEVFPKVDEEYIAKLSKEEAEIKEKTAKAALQLKANAEEEKKNLKEKFLSDSKTTEKAGTVIIGVFIILMCGTVAFLFNHRSLLDTTAILSFLLISFGVVGIVLYYCNKINIAKAAHKNGIYPDYIVQQFKKIDENVSAAEARLYSQMEKEIKVLKSDGTDYKKGSEFHKNLATAELLYLKAQLEYHSKAKQLEPFMEILTKDFFVKGPDLLQRTIDNIDSLCSWAVNYLREQKREEHYREMASIEEEKIRVQKAMKSAQDKALKQQNDYFREQTENIKAQAKAAAEQARHAEQMAKYMEQNAKEAEEIRRRMDDEGFGRNRRI